MIRKHAPSGDDTRRYNVVSVQVPVVFNFDGDHDYNGMIYALAHNRTTLEEIRIDFEAYAKTPQPLVRPLVLRARVGETVEIDFENLIRHRHVGIHLIAGGYNVLQSDGAHVGQNPSSLAGPPESGSNKRTYRWKCLREGVFPFHDAGNLSGGEEGTNVHGLFGALVVEPAGAAWSDPVTGDRLDEPNAGPEGYSCGDGLYMDVHPRGWGELPDTDKTPFDHPPCAKPKAEASFREYVIFFHDEPEYMPAHETLEPPPCPDEMSVGVGHCCSSSCCHSSGGWDEHRGRHLGHHHDHGRGCGSSHSHHRCRQVDHGGRGRGAGHDHGRHGGSEDEGLPPIMPISYRAEPMANRERKLWRMEYSLDTGPGLPPAEPGHRPGAQPPERQTGPWRASQPAPISGHRYAEAGPRRRSGARRL